MPDRKSENMPDSMSEYLPEKMSETIKIYDVCQDVYNISLMHFEGSVESQASYGSSSLLEHWSWVDCRHSSSTS